MIAFPRVGLRREWGVRRYRELALPTNRFLGGPWSLDRPKASANVEEVCSSDTLRVGEPSVAEKATPLVYKSMRDRSQRPTRSLFSMIARQMPREKEKEREREKHG